MNHEQLRPRPPIGATLLIALSVQLTAGFEALAESAPARPQWLTDLSAARKRAKDTNRPLLIHFHADWCGPCRKMEAETLSTRALAAQLHGRFVAVKVNFDRNQDAAKQLGVTGLPSEVFVAPDGSVLSRSAGYRTQREYLSLVARVEADFSETAGVPAGQSKPPADSEKPPAKKVAPEPPPDSGVAGDVPPARKKPRAGKQFLGIDGYSPVALQRSREWVEGKAEFAHEHQGVNYWMANAEEKKAFAANSQKYAPRLLGCDPVLLNETDRALPGRIEFGAFFDAKLFFFVSAENRAKFRNNPLRYTRTRHVLRIDQIEPTVWR